MIGQCLLNKNESATVSKSKIFSNLNKAQATISLLSYLLHISFSLAISPLILYLLLEVILDKV